MSSHAQPIPKAPPERTLLVAVTILSVVAIVQIAATGLALAPRFDYEKLGRAVAPRPSAATETATTVPIDQSNAANELLAEAQKFRDDGNFQGALEAVTEADRLLPNKIGILSAMANDCAMLGKNAELVAVCQRIIALPPSSDPIDASTREQAQKVLAQAKATGVAPATEAPASDAGAAKESGNMRDDIGIPIGSVMGIVSAKLLDGDPGQKNLRVATKAASGQKIDPMKFQATVDFYEQDDHGQILHNDSPRPNEWLSGPAVDWVNSDPEIFQVKYRLPLEDRGDLPALQYYGYVVAIYYNGELQDQRAEPSSLLDQYRPALHKDLPAE